MSSFAQELFYLTKIGGSDCVPDGDPNTIYFHDPNDSLENWRSLHDIAAKASSHSVDQSKITNQLCIVQDKSKESKEYKYLVAQLDLFGKLCKVKLQLCTCTLR